MPCLYASTLRLRLGKLGRSKQRPYLERETPIMIAEIERTL